MSETKAARKSFRGRCHCGNVEIIFATSLRAEQLPIRACSCSFCRSHGARTTSDPKGSVKITVHDPNELICYQFGLKTADFLVCGRCGIYMGAVTVAGGKTYATVNSRTFDSPERITQQPLTVTYDGETEAERRARRKKHWTPVAEISVDRV